MKKFNKHIAAFLISLGLLTSCDLSLDLQPISEIGEGSFYQTDSDFVTAMVACYNGLQAPLANEWALTELRSDNSRLHNSQTSSNIYIPLRELDLMTFTSEHLYIYNYWSDTYQNISRINTILDKLENVQDPALKDLLQAEASFLRAYHYFNLVRLFGEVFLVDTRISAQQATEMQVASTEEIFQFILDDLAIATANLPGSYPESYNGRATSWAAKALLGKVYRNLNRYPEAELVLADVVNNSPNILLPGNSGYSNVFATDNEMNAEILFAVRYKAGGLGIGGPFANYFAPQNSGSYVINGDGNHFNRPSDDLISQFSENDLRMNSSLQLGYTGAEGAFVPDPYVSKFYSDVAISQDAENDFPIIRFADVLLLYAEALNENGKTSMALEYLNRIRERAGLETYEASDIASSEDFTTKLLLERRLEFAFENQRWYDLVHFNLVEQTLDTQFENEVFYSEYTFGISPVQSDKLLLPLPQREVDIFNQ
ncbi:RagB/SusD family nutrient uptake outer membrane protein [Algoriphagus chordae]|uniref:Putative outer membrane starch-binding protein n=1 Tax=Algoriphagus chordae TaxID=237019 RepID=A0A2W7QMY4_9BACT|nr:RagB/SusD family nutrient uptake outer membrane protein [Algoriphagus chordae]PZX49823.1 putative outer membrane starch-binding protein [Algoriphagus chordae]